MLTASIGGGNATLPPAWVGSRLPTLPPRLELPAALAEKDLPATIQRACTRVQFWREGPFAALKARDRAVLAEVVRCVDRKQPALPAFVRRDSLAERESCSVPTITRALSRLAELGWLLRDQVKSRSRGFQVGSVQLTDAAIAWLGLLTPTLNDLCESPVIDASGESGNQCIHRQSTPSELLAKSPENRHSVGRKKSGAVPDALRWLEQVRISRAGVFMLMGLARRKGLLLETVTTACRTQIEQARQPFAYVRDLLALDRDWGRVVQQQEDEAQLSARQAQADEHRVRLAARLEALEGLWFLSPAKQQLVRAESAVFRIHEMDAQGRAGVSLGVAPQAEAILKAIDAGRLVPWRTPAH